MRAELRFLLAILLMVGVLVGTNLLFPPVPPEPPGATPAEEQTVPAPPPAGEQPPRAAPEREEPHTAAPAGDPGPTAPPEPEPDEAPPPRRVEVTSPLYRLTFNTHGARLTAAELLRFESFAGPGPVQLLPEDEPGALATRLLMGGDTVDLRTAPFEVTPAEGLRLQEDTGPGTLRWTYRHPTLPYSVELEYTFQPDSYIVRVSGRVRGGDRGVLFADLGSGMAFNESRRSEEVRAMAYVANHLREGIRSESLDKVEGTRVVEGPFRWVAFKSKYFVLAILPGEEDDAAGAHLGGLVARGLEGENRTAVTVTQPLREDGAFSYRLFLGPQDYARLSALGSELEEVNPYGWRFFRPIVRPFVAVIITVLVFLHANLEIGYGWVLVLFGVLMRIVLFPLNHRAMKAQLRNLAVQPLLKEIQDKHKDNPERLQKEMVRLYKEHGFNPLAGCVPMLLPWPVLIALFFVFQNTIELRGVPFLWLPDLSAPDPFFILPAILGLSMFVLQWVSLRSMDAPNPQMKMMMWIMPFFMVFIFLNLASGLNLYYTTANLATLPQQYWIVKERKKIQAKPLATGTSS